MLSYQDLSKHFGADLFSNDLQALLADHFPDLTNYDVRESDYVISSKHGIEFGFINHDAVYDEDENILFESGTPVFSHFNLYPQSAALMTDLPFKASFKDSRTEILKKAGKPTQTRQGYADFSHKHFLVDNYKVNEIIITFDYDAQQQFLNFIQVRDNNLQQHLKL